MSQLEGPGEGLGTAGPSQRDVVLPLGSGSGSPHLLAGKGLRGDLNSACLDLRNDKEQGGLDTKRVWLCFKCVLPSVAESSLALWDIH